MNRRRPTSPTIAVLGATGFIGRYLTDVAAKRGLDVVAVIRRANPDITVETRVVPNFRDAAALAESIHGVDVIIHLADEAGRFADAAGQSIAATLARIADRRRIVFASSIYARLDAEGTANSYGRRKREQEQMLLRCGNAIGLRLPPVYGTGCGGSFALLAKAIERRLPLPLGLAIEPRSYLSLSNACDLFLALAIASEDRWRLIAPGLVEPEDATRISTRDLARALAGRTGKRATLLPVPRGVLAWPARLLGREELVSGAFAPLAARGNKILEQAIDWVPADGLPASLYGAAFKAGANRPHRSSRSR